MRSTNGTHHTDPAMSVDSTRPTIIHATREDVPVLLAMIRELADHEHAIDSVLATEQTLLSTLSFAPTPTSPPSGPGYAKSLILRLPHSEGGGVAGMALYFNNYSTWLSAPGVYLEDLYVREQYRGRGYGKLLIKALAVECKRIGGGRVEWCCLKWNEPSLKFYRSLGAKEMKEWVTLRVDGDVLDDMVEDALDEAKVRVG